MSAAALVVLELFLYLDTKHHLIVAHQVTNIGNDRTQLTKMAVAAREAMGKSKLQALCRARLLPR